MIETLPQLRPDISRSRRTVAQCHDRLARRRRRLECSGATATGRYLAVERAILGAFCVLYISGVALVALDVLIAR